MTKHLLSISIFLASISTMAANVPEFRGQGRTGIYPETGLLKTWGDSPKLLWKLDNMGEGYLPPSVVDGKLYLCALDSSQKKEMLKVLDLDGKLLWEIAYGTAFKGSYKNARIMPTIVGDFAYMISGSGEVSCVNIKDKKIAWSVDALKEYSGNSLNWGYGENPLVFDGKIVFTVGGNKTSLIALDANTGKELWTSKSFEHKTTYLSPILVEHKGKKQVVAAVETCAFGIDAENGKELWSIVLKKQTPEKKPKNPKDQAYGHWKVLGASPIYSDGKLFITSGYDAGSLLLELPEGKGKVKELWQNTDFDNHHGGVVLLNGKLYGANWDSNQSGKWMCVDFNTGKTIYNEEWKGFSKGSLVSADGLLYVYEEKKGQVALVNPNSNSFDIISSFTIKDGRGSHWSHIVISDKVMYIKRGEVLYAFDIKE